MLKGVKSQLNFNPVVKQIDNEIQIKFYQKAKRMKKISAFREIALEKSDLVNFLCQQTDFLLFPPFSFLFLFKLLKISAWLMLESI